MSFDNNDNSITMECYNMINCTNCLCLYRNSFLEIKPHYKTIHFNDFTYHAQVILQMIQELDKTNIKNQYDILVDMKNLPEFLYKENDFQRYGVIYPNMAFLLGSRRTNKEFTYFVFHCDKPLIYNTLGGLTLFSFLFYLKKFKKCVSLLRSGYCYTTFDQLVCKQFLKEKYNQHQYKIPSVIKKLKRKLNIK